MQGAKKILLIMVVMVLLSIFVSEALTSGEINQLVNSSIGLYYMDLGGFRDNSTVANTATVTGTNLTTNCIVENCMYFDNEQSVVFSNVEQYQEMNNGSVTCWLNNTGTGGQGRLIGRYNGVVEGNWLIGGGTTDNSDVYARIYSNSGSFTTSCKGLFATSAWNMFTMTWDDTNNNLSIWVNKTFCSNVSFTSEMSGRTNDLYIGRVETIGSNEDITGRIDECGMFNKTLTEAEIEYMYDETNAGRHLLNFSEDIISPQINFSINVTQLSQGDIINMTANVSDERALSFCQFSVNSTGATRYFNISISGTQAECSQNVTISQADGTIILFNLTVNDTSNNLNHSSILKTIETTADITPPSANITNQNASITLKFGDVWNISAFIQDDIALSKANITFNLTGKISQYNFQFTELSGTTIWISQNITINVTRGVIINASVGVTDSSSNVATNSTLVTIGNTVPEVPTISYPINNTNHSSIKSINYTSSDVDRDTLTYYVYINDKLNTTTATNITQWNASDGYYYIVVSSYDNELFSSNSSFINFTLDSTPPITTATMTSPPDGASYTNNTWTTENVKVTLSANDAIIGFDNTKFPVYCTDTANICSPDTFISSGVTVSTEGTNYIRYYSNDTLNNSETVKFQILKIDKTAPIVNATLNKSLTSIVFDDVINITSNTTDNLGLSFGQIIVNDTGTKRYFNFSLSGTTSTLSQNITVSCVRGCVINFTTRVNDTINQFTTNSTIITVADTLPTVPTSDSLTPNSPVITDELTGSCSGSTDADNDAITYHCRFYDITDSNERQAFSSDCTYQLSPPADSHDQFRVDCRATTANGNSEDRTGTDLETVENTNPIQANITNTTGLSYNSNQTFNVTPSTDADFDTLTYSWFLNSSTDSYPNLVKSGVETTNWTTNVTDDTTYYLFVNVSDGTVSISGALFSFSLDASLPSIVSTSINNSAPKLNKDVAISVHITDDGGLSSCWYAHNISTFKNISSVNILGTQLELNYSVNVTNTLTRENVVKSQFTCNDTLGNTVQSSEILWTVADTVGFIALGKNMTTIRVNDVINISGNITEPDGDITSGWVTENQTIKTVEILYDDFESAAFSTNWTTSGNTAVSTKCVQEGTYSALVNSSSGTITSIAFDTTSYTSLNISYWIRMGNDSCSENPDDGEDLAVEYYNKDGNWARIYQINATGTDGMVAGESANFSHSISSLAAFHSGFKLRFNKIGGNTGDYDYWHIDEVNLSGESGKHLFTLSGYNANFSQNITISTVRGNVINFTVFYEDAAEKQYQNSTLLTVANTAPLTPTISYPVNNNNYNNIKSINYTSSDIDNDAITYYVYINGKINTTTTVNITNWNASDGTYKLNVSAYDGTDFSSNSSAIEFVLDTILPIVNTTINNTSPKINEIINITANMTDAIGLSFCQFIHNMTEIVNITNVSLSGTSAQCSNVTQISVSRGNVINFTIRVNDTSDNWKMNNTIITVADTLPTVPTTDGLTPNGPDITDTLTGSCSGSTDADSDAITYHYRFYDITDSNERQAFSTDNTYTLSPPGDSHDQFRVDCRATTTYGNSATDRTGTDTEIVINTAPTSPNIVNTTDSYYNSNQVFNVTPSTDADLDTLTYFWFRNTSSDLYPNLVGSGEGLTNYTTNETSDGSYFLFVNVSDGYVNVTGALFKWTYDVTIPTVNTTLNKSIIYKNDVINITGNITDNIGLSFCQIIINQSGFNEIVNFSLTGTSGQCSNKSQVTLSAGGVINYTIRVNDSANNWRTNDTIITIINRVPTSANIINASNQFFNTNQTFNITSSTDADLDTLTYSWFYNLTDGSYVYIGAGTTWTNWTTNLTDGTYGILVNVSDVSANVSSDYFNFTIDSVAPIVNTTLNKTTIYYGDVINITSNITDSSGLSFCQIIMNQTTTEYINISIEGRTVAQCSNTSEITVYGGSVINYTIRVNDTAGNWRTNDTIITVVDNIFPIVNTTFNITSPNVYDVINFTGNITDETGLSTGNITVNLTTGTVYHNYTLSGTSAQISNVTTFTSGGVFNFTMYVTDTNNNVKQNSTLITVTDNVIPIINCTFNISINNIKINDVLNFSCNATDETGLLMGNLTHNMSGILVKNNHTISGTSATIYNLTEITVIKGEIINFTGYVTDTSNNVKQNSTLITIENTVPEVPTISYPVNNNNYNNIKSINYSSSDADSNTITYKIYINGTLNASTLTNITQWNASDGHYNLTIYSDDGDSSGNATIYFTLDQTSPELNLLEPQDAYTYTSLTLELNHTVSDAMIGLDTCWYQNGTSAPENFTITCNTNTTIKISNAGSNTTYFWANDTVGNLASASASWTISLSEPAVNTLYPLNDSWFDYKEDINFNYTVDDPNDNGIRNCSLYGNWSEAWTFNGTNNTIINENTEYAFIRNLTDGQYIYNVECWEVTDTFNGWDNDNKTFGVDTTYPSINFTGLTPENNTNSTATNLFVNVSMTEENFNSVTFSLHNPTTIVNEIKFTELTNNVTFAGLADNTYYYNVTINDSAGNANTTETRLIRIDDTAPSISILLPQAQNYGYNTSLLLNYTTSDNVVGLDECWYYIYNSSGSLIKATTTLSTCQNTTFNLKGGTDTDYTVTVFSKDLLANTASDDVTFGIRMVSPAIVLDNPSDNYYFNTLLNLDFNFTATDSDGLTSCELWGNWSGTWKLNQTTHDITSGVQIKFNNTNVTLDEYGYKWNVWCNDTLNNSDFALSNLTFYVDTVKPEVNLTSPTSTTYTSTSVTFSHEESDYALDTCVYNYTDDLGAVKTNTAVTCNSEESLTFSDGRNYDFWYTVTDKADNINSTNISFTISTATTPSSGGGGGGGATVIEIINETNVTITERICNFNGICEGNRGEDFLNCPQGEGGDCKFERRAINPFCFINPQGEQCIYKFAIVVRVISALMLVSLFIITFLPQEDIDRFKRKFRNIKIQRIKRRVST